MCIRWRVLSVSEQWETWAAKTWHPHLHESQRTTDGVFSCLWCGSQGRNSGLYAWSNYLYPLSHLISQSTQTQNLTIYVFVFIFWVIPQLWKLSPENISTQLRAINGVWEESMRRVADFKSLHGASVFFSNKSGWDELIFPSLWPPSPMIKPNNSPCSLSYIPGL